MAKCLDTFDINKNINCNNIVKIQNQSVQKIGYIKVQKSPLQKVIQAYSKAVLYGQKYIHQSLPRLMVLFIYYIETRDEYYQQFVNNQILQKQQQSDNIFITDIINTLKNEIPVYKYTIIIQLLLDKNSKNQIVNELRADILIKILQAYAYQSVWWFIPQIDGNFQDLSSQSNIQNQNNDFTTSNIIQIIINKLQTTQIKYYKEIFPYWEQCRQFIQLLKSLSKEDTNKEYNITKGNTTKHLIKKYNLEGDLFPEIILPLKKYLYPVIPQNEFLDQDFNPYPQNFEVIYGLVNDYQIISSKERPKKIQFLIKYQKDQQQTDQNSNKNTHSFLLKNEEIKTDVRKEQRTTDLINTLNTILLSSKFYKERNMQMKSYQIISISQQCSLIEWLENHQTLKLTYDNQSKQQGKFITNINRQVKNNQFNQQQWQDILQLKTLIPKYYKQKYGQNMFQYYTSIQNFTKSMALWSVFTLIIGLGDRHPGNILIDNDSGQLAHIDFDCIFHKGKLLGIPEIVPFRLTNNLVDNLGPLKSFGLFRYYFIQISELFKKNQDQILSQLNSYEYCPISDNNLQNCYSNFKIKLQNNLNFKDYDNSKDFTDQMIKLSTDEKLLKKMYFGWSPYL